MKLIALAGILHDGKLNKAGSQVEVDDAEGEVLLARGFARELTDAELKAVKAAEAEKKAESKAPAKDAK